MPTGTRYLVRGRLALPSISRWGFIEPSLEVIHRRYNLDRNDEGLALPDIAQPAFDKNPSLTNTRLALDAGLIFERQANFFGAESLQTLEPRIFILHADTSASRREDQDYLPLYDSTSLTPSWHQLFRARRFTGYDRLGDASQVSVGLSSNVWSLTTGARKMMLGVGQAFYLDDRSIAGNEPGFDAKASRSPIFLTASMNFSPAVSFSMDLNWEDDQILRSQASLKYQSLGGRLLNLSWAQTQSGLHKNRMHRFHAGHEQETSLSMVLPVGQSFQIFGRWDHAWDSGSTIESALGLEYNGCCWKARLVYRRYLEERQIAITSLDGIGAIGGRLQDRQSAQSGIHFDFELKGLGSANRSSLTVDTITGYQSP